MKAWTGYGESPRLTRYSIGLKESSEILIRFSLYQRMYLDFTYSKNLSTSGVRRNDTRDGNLPKRQYTDEFKIEAIRLSDLVVIMGPYESLVSPRRQ